MRGSPVPRGFIGHEDTANGRSSGKSDPGARFPWEALFRRIKEILDPPEFPPRLTVDEAAQAAALWALRQGGYDLRPLRRKPGREEHLLIMPERRE